MYICIFVSLVKDNNTKIYLYLKNEIKLWIINKFQDGVGNRTNHIFGNIEILNIKELKNGSDTRRNTKATLFQYFLASLFYKIYEKKITIIVFRKKQRKKIIEPEICWFRGGAEGGGACKKKTFIVENLLNLK